MKRMVAVCALLALAGCRERQPQNELRLSVDTGGTAVIAIPSNLDYANGLLSGERWSQEVNRNMLYLTLLRYDDHLNLAPYLATSWQMEGDTAVVLNLRNDVRWHDGVKTSAYDVEFTYRYGKDPKTEYPNGDYWVGWNRAEVLDSFRIRFSISPQPDALANLPWIPIMPEHLLGKIKPEDLKKADFNQHPIGNGPFKFVEYKPNDRWVFEANRDFPKPLGGRPNLDRVVFRIIPDETAQEAEIITGNIDLTTIRPDRAPALAQKPHVRIIQKQGKQYSFIAWNTKHPPLNDARVRRALTMAIDRKKIIDAVRGGSGEVAVGPVPSFHWSFDKNIQPLPYAPDSARALLKQAGAENLKLELKVPSNNRQNADIAEIIRSDLAAVGVQLTVRPLDFNTVVADLTSPKRNFQGVLMAWENDFRLVLHDQFHSKAVNNPFQFASYRNASVDSLLDFVEATPSREKAIPAWRRLQTIIRDEQPWTFLFYYNDTYAVRDRLQHVNMDIRGILVTLPRWTALK